MSEKTDNITGGQFDPVDFKPEPSPARMSSTDVSQGAPPAPRVAHFGEGDEGGGARRGRGVAGARAGAFERFAQFLHDVRLEMRRVSWPSAKEVKNTTIITVIAVIFFAVYLFVVDYGLAFFITQLERFVNWLMGGA